MIVHPHKVYTDLSSYVSDFVFFKDEAPLVIVTLYVLASYFMCHFPSTGYLHLRGEKSSGKTRCLNVLEPVVFNGMASVNLHPQVLCHAIDNNRCTVLWDEAQHIGRGGSRRSIDLINILKAGIYSGAQVMRYYGGKVHRYDIFGSKIFAGSSHLDLELADRLIEIQMLRNLPSEPVSRYVPTASMRRRQQQIRDQLYSLALIYGGVVDKLQHAVEQAVEGLGLEGRAFDLYLPILAMAMFLDGHSSTNEFKFTDMVIGFARQSKELKSRQELIDSTIVQMLTLVRDFIKAEALTPDDKNQIRTFTDELYDFAKEREHIPTHRSKHWLTRQLHDIGVDNRPERVGGFITRVYRFNVKDFEDRCRRSLPPDENSVTPNCNAPKVPK